MPYKCCIPGCTTGYASSIVTHHLSMHRFPRRHNKTVLAQWIQSIEHNIGITNFRVTDNSRICSLHFHPADFEQQSKDTNNRRSRKRVSDALLKVYLKEHAVPSKFSVPKKLRIRGRNMEIVTQSESKDQGDYDEDSENGVIPDSEHDLTLECGVDGNSECNGQDDKENGSIVEEDSRMSSNLEKTPQATDAASTTGSTTSKGKKKYLRIYRGYTNDERKDLLQRATNDVVNFGVSLRLASDKYGLAKSSLCDYMKKNGIDVRTRGYLKVHGGTQMYRKRSTVAAMTTNDAASTASSEKSIKIAAKPDSTNPPSPTTKSANQAALEAFFSGSFVLKPEQTFSVKREEYTSNLPTQVPMSSFFSATCATNNKWSNDHNVTSSKRKRNNVNGNVSNYVADGLGIPLVRPVTEDLTLDDDEDCSNEINGFANDNDHEKCENSMDSALTIEADGDNITDNFCSFVNQSTSPYHLISQSKRRLLRAGFVELSESEPWNLQANGKYFVIRDGISLVALSTGDGWIPGNGFSVVSAGTHSPSIRVHSDSLTLDDMVRCRVETSGEGQWTSWLDRDLTVAGRVLVRQQDKLVEKLVHVQRPLFKIPGPMQEQLRNDALAPILCTDVHRRLISVTTGASDPKQLDILSHLLAQELHLQDIANIADVDLYLADTQSATLGGAFQEFIYGQQLSSRISVFCGLEAFIETSNGAKSAESEPICRVLAIHGQADSQFVENVLRRASASLEPCCYERSVPQSFVLKPVITSPVNDETANLYSLSLRKSSDSRASSLIRECVLRQAMLQLDKSNNQLDNNSSLFGMSTSVVYGSVLSQHSVRETTTVAMMQQTLDLLRSYFVQYPSVLTSYVDDMQ